MPMRWFERDSQRYPAKQSNVTGRQTGLTNKICEKSSWYEAKRILVRMMGIRVTIEHERNKIKLSKQAAFEMEIECK